MTLRGKHHGEKIAFLKPNSKNSRTAYRPTTEYYGIVIFSCGIYVSVCNNRFYQ